MKSIFCQLTDECFVCGRHDSIEIHHIFGGANRKLSEKYGLKVPLCHWCHNEPPNGVHHNKEFADSLKAMGQMVFEVNYPELNFRELFGRNYIESD